jgi:metallo-beta-lactamase family protein
MEITFLGAAGTVTGAKFLVTSGRTRLLVDCGLYQGVKALRLRNWKELPVDPSHIDAVALTHAHIDHSGFLPALVRDGFSGPIYTTPPTKALCEIMLPDAGRIQEEDARYANKEHFSKHSPALPLYTEEDALRVLPRIRTVHFGSEVEVGDLTIRLQLAGHILGAASVWVSDGETSVLFSGDLGRTDDLLMHPPEPPCEADFLVVESTYGDREHSEVDPIGSLGSILERTVGRGGVLVIPSFAVGRAQTLLYCLHQIFEQRENGPIPVYVDSPMATDVTELYTTFAPYHRLTRAQCDAVCDVAKFTRSVEESKALDGKRWPMALISASGMATAGRILHHLKAFAPDPRNTIVLPGFQAPGTRGASLAAGAPSIKIHGRYVPVGAEVVQLDFFSAHADQSGLLDWLGACPRPPKRVFVTHGEPVASDTLRRVMGEKLGYEAYVPDYQETVRLR